MKQMHITETVLRDANQSLIATRMPMSDFEPILETMDQAGYYALECWGGATFDSCLRYLHEDPWERLRKIRKVVKNTKLQMLLRGQNLLGYKHYPDDIVRAFVRKSVENGMDIIRIFRRARTTCATSKPPWTSAIKAGGHAQGCPLLYRSAPSTRRRCFVTLGKTARRRWAAIQHLRQGYGGHHVAAESAYDLVIGACAKSGQAARSSCTPTATTGLGPMTYLKAAEAGAAAIDCATAVHLRRHQPSPPPSRMRLRPGADGLLTPAWTASTCSKRSTTSSCPVQGQASRLSGLFDPGVSWPPTPTALDLPGRRAACSPTWSPSSRRRTRLDRLQAVLEETPRVRADLGYPAAGHPASSQMVGVQATVNVLLRPAV